MRHAFQSSAGLGRPGRSGHRGKARPRRVGSQGVRAVGRSRKRVAR
ncbi:hypothetical protein C884_01041 [Kocuria palustris PEL]|uniref:Uncharacterized protein n=1 Tax=Kocuria palustris PEL TaxID=1236550 RepID=M2WGH9_9MICC|nr:hypothetical protein C884_01041 [Kocuria palustris PEL]